MFAWEILEERGATGYVRHRLRAPHAPAECQKQIETPARNKRPRVWCRSADHAGVSRGQG